MSFCEGSGKREVGEAVAAAAAVVVMEKRDEFVVVEIAEVAGIVKRERESEEVEAAAIEDSAPRALGTSPFDEE